MTVSLKAMGRNTLVLIMSLHLPIVYDDFLWFPSSFQWIQAFAGRDSSASSRNFIIFFFSNCTGQHLQQSLALWVMTCSQLWSQYFIYPLGSLGWEKLICILTFYHRHFMHTAISERFYSKHHLNLTMNNFLCLSVLDSHVFKVRQSLFNYYYYMCLFTCMSLCNCVCVSLYAWRGQRTACGSQFSTSTTWMILHPFPEGGSSRQNISLRTFPVVATRPGPLWVVRLWCQSRGEPGFRTRWGDRRWRSHPPPWSVLSFCTAWGGGKGRRREDIPEDQLSPGNWWELPLLRSRPFLSSSPVDSLGRIPKAGKWPEKVRLASLSELLMACEERGGADMEGVCWCWWMMGTQTSSVPLPVLWWTRASQLFPPLDTETECGHLKKCTELPSWVA